MHQRLRSALVRLHANAVAGLTAEAEAWAGTATQAAGFRITVEPSGRQFTARADETILEAGLRQGVPLYHGCRDGQCGSCKCRKLSGSVAQGPYRREALGADDTPADFVLTCCARARGDVVLESRHVTDADAHPIRRMPARVLSLSRPSHDVMRLRLQLPPGEPLRFHAGQYIDFMLRDGKRRSYSIANAPHTLRDAPELGIELHIRHLPGGSFTDHVFSAMKEKEVLRLEGPFGSFFLRESSDKPIVLLASGTGFAPIKAMLEHMQLGGLARPAALYWGGRRPADLYMDQWVREQVAKMRGLRYVPVVSDAAPEDAWHGRSGLVHLAVMQDFPDLSGHQVYACGAPVMVDAARREFVARCGLPPDEFFADAFLSQADKASATST